MSGDWSSIQCVGTANNGSMANGTEAILWDCHGNFDQRWHLTTDGLIKNALSGKCIGLANKGSLQNGTPLVVWDCHGHPDQHWVSNKTGADSFTGTLHNQYATDKCIGLANNGSMDNGTGLVVWDCHGHADFPPRIREWETSTSTASFTSSTACCPDDCVEREVNRSSARRNR
jgi:hypothetical protein